MSDRDGSESDTESPATDDELAELRRLHDDDTGDWMPEDGYPIRGGLSAYGVIEVLLRTIEATRKFNDHLARWVDDHDPADVTGRALTEYFAEIQARRGPASGAG